MIIRPARLVVFALACACADAPASERAPARGAGEESSTQRDTMVRKADIPPLPTLFDSVTVDVDGDGTAERIDLGTEAGRDERGRMNWDHTNVWLVVVRDGRDSYPLLQESIPGAAAFWVIAGDSTHPAEILVQTSGLTTIQGGTRLEKFVFDRSRGGYLRTGMVEGWGSRAFYRGPPEPKELFPPTSWRGGDPDPD
ncbi:MAG: hypothetical protein ACJ8J0_25565 [Longimicrobiaceae bacterium]